MLAGLTAEQKKKLSLKDAKAYKFLTRVWNSLLDV
jgi:hypothetical protein